jgi:5'-3' exonuclease
MMQLKNNDDELDEDMVRHMVLSSLKSYKKKFTEEYGQMILCYDSKHYWRKQVFPYYKQNRKKDRQKSKFDWNKIFDCLNKIRDEIRDNFPFIVIEVYGAEADDVIAILCKYQSIRNISLQKQNRTPEKTLVLSGDKDFIQLQKYPSVSQFNPLQKKFVTGIDPKMYVKEHIIKGDRSDGIPNFLSPDDTFVEGKRQKPISIKNIDKWIQRDPETYCNEEQLRNYHRNKKLVDLDQIPEDIEKNIINSFAELISKKRSKVNFDYFYRNKLFSLMTELEDFND